MSLKDWFDGKKTYIVAACTFVIAVADAILQYYDTGRVDLQPVLLAGIALAQIFLRQGVSKIQKEG